MNFFDRPIPPDPDPSSRIWVTMLSPAEHRSLARLQLATETPHGTYMAQMHRKIAAYMQKRVAEGTAIVGVDRGHYQRALAVLAARGLF
jgi:hypothetical protein